MTNPKLPKGQLFINGKWRDAADGSVAPTFNPANEQEIMKVAQATLGDVNDAVDAAHEAFENGEWRKMGPHDKARVLNRIGDLIEENADELAALESMDMGKPLAFARHFDIQFIAGLFHFYAGVASGQLGGATRQVTPSESGNMPLAYTRKEPVV